VGHEHEFLLQPAERRLSDRKGDRRLFAREWARCAESGHSPDRGCSARLQKLFKTEALECAGVIPDIANWRAVYRLLKRNEKALEESSARADALAADGDQDGADTWRRVTTADEELASTTAPGPLD
jgi:hypothetical protein